jgi:SAM-dependent methyltransferase
MTSNIESYIRKVMNKGFVKSPCLDVGSGPYGQQMRDLLSQKGIEYICSDMDAQEGIDRIVNFEDPPEKIRASLGRAETFGSILLLSVLEHTLHPDRVLDNALSVLDKGGTCIVTSPCVWQIHSIPSDYWRINPNFYERFCTTRNVRLLDESFEYIGFGNVRDFRGPTGDYAYPQQTKKRGYLLYSRAIHRIFNTCGRRMFFPSNIDIGVVIQK